MIEVHDLGPVNKAHGIVQGGLRIVQIIKRASVHQTLLYCKPFFTGMVVELVG